MLSESLKAVLAQQQLVKTADGRADARQWRYSSVVRQWRFDQGKEDLLRSSRDPGRHLEGMQTMDQALQELSTKTDKAGGSLLEGYRQSSLCRAVLGRNTRVISRLQHAAPTNWLPDRH